MNRSRMDAPAYLIQFRQAIAQFLPARGLPLIQQARRWSDRLLVLVMLLMVWSSGQALVDRFNQARAAAVAMYLSRRRPGKSLAGFMAILTRHSPRLLRVLITHLRCRLMDKQAFWRVGRHLALGFDATKIDCPRTRANQKRFKVGGKKKSGPQMLLGTLVHLGTGLPWAWRRGIASTPERTLLRELLGELPAGCLLVTDAGLTGYDLLKTILQGGHSILMRVGANVTLLEKLGYYAREKQGIVYLWSRRAQAQDSAPLILRQIQLVDGRNRRMCLLTDLLSPKELTLAQARTLYRRRWGLEVLFRSMKQTLARRKMLCDSPAHAQVELDWCVMGLWMLGMLLLEKRSDQAPVQEGFAQALRIVRHAMGAHGSRRASFARQLLAIGRDRYRRVHAKKARNWPRKKRERPCGLAKVRTATKREVQLAKGLRLKIWRETLTA